MSFSTNIKNIKNSRKIHQCSWCAELIAVGTEYVRWRHYDNSDAMTCKLHPECYNASKELEYGETFYSGENPRGCSCGYTRGCENCAKITQLTTEPPAAANG